MMSWSTTACPAFLVKAIFFLLGGNDDLPAFGGFDQIFAGTLDGNPDGNDTIRAQLVGNDIFTSDGDDTITLQAQRPSGFNEFQFDLGDRANTVFAEVGDDTVLGGGADRIILGRNISSDTVTLGRGRDTIDLNPNPIPDIPATDIVTDFQAGDRGDTIDLASFFTDQRGQTAVFDSSPYFGLVQEGDDTFVIIPLDDRAPSRAGFDPLPVEDTDFTVALRLDGVNASDLTAANFFVPFDDDFVPAETTFAAFNTDDFLRLSHCQRAQVRRYSGAGLRPSMRPLKNPRVVSDLSGGRKAED